MKRLVAIAVLCLFTSLAISANELSEEAYKFAETQLLAEWVGLPDQQHALATAYYTGNGVKQDYLEAAKWFRLAADQGLAKSQHMLGVMYDQGDGMPQDYLTAVTWFRKAADQGYEPAEFALGNTYAMGKGVPQSYAEAYVWFSLAAASGDPKAVEERDRYAGKLSDKEIMQAQQRAAQLFEKIQQINTAD